jgi:hypothetical protein
VRVLVCGGREYDDWGALSDQLDRMNHDRCINLLIHGAAIGADIMAQEWALRNNVQSQAYYADWKAHGRAAGPIRNQRMLDDGRPDLVIAFPGGRGTRDMVTRARTAGVRVIEV